MLLDFTLNFFHVSFERVSELVHLLFLIIDVDQMLVIVNLEFWVEFLDFQIGNALLVQPENLHRLLLEVLVLDLQLLVDPLLVGAFLWRKMLFD